MSFAPTPVLSLAASGTNLFAGGGFFWVTNADGGVVQANLIARWDGSSWSSLGSGLAGEDPFSSVRGMAVCSDGNLYAAGLFTSASGAPASLIARWDGRTWWPLGEGISGNGLNGASVSALAASGTSLFVGGSFTVAGNVASAYAAQAIVGTSRIVTTNSHFGIDIDSRQFGFDVAGGAFQKVAIQATTDLTNWVPLQTNVMSSDFLGFHDSSTGTFARRLYRVRPTR
jgi:hypothetical protein